MLLMNARQKRAHPIFSNYSSHMHPPFQAAYAFSSPVDPRGFLETTYDVRQSMMSLFITAFCLSASLRLRMTTIYHPALTQTEQESLRFARRCQAPEKSSSSCFDDGLVWITRKKWELLRSTKIVSLLLASIALLARAHPAQPCAVRSGHRRLQKRMPAF